MARTTLKDVAEYVGVSAKTVSNVVNGTGLVSDELAVRVRAAIRELGYRPNASARMLRSGKTGLVGVVTPDLSQPYFAEIASEIVKAAETRNVTVVVMQTDGRPEIERQVADGIGMPSLDGLIMSPLKISADELIGRVDSPPLVLLGEHIGDSPLCHVGVDNKLAAYTATKHLLDLGRQRIVALGAQRGHSHKTAELRLAGYHSALTGASVSADEALLAYVGEYSRQAGYVAMREILATKVAFDAVFAFNDLMAIGAIRAIQEAGLRVPEDVAVVGFDDIEETRFGNPSITTISPNKGQLATMALESVLQAHPADSSRSQIVPFALTIRESTRGALR